MKHAGTLDFTHIALRVGLARIPQNFRDLGCYAKSMARKIGTIIDLNRREGFPENIALLRLGIFGFGYSKTGKCEPAPNKCHHINLCERTLLSMKNTARGRDKLKWTNLALNLAVFAASADGALGEKTIVSGLHKRNGWVSTEIVPDAGKATLQKVVRGKPHR